MSIEPIIDISMLDLSTPVMRREEIAQWLPHRGHMAQIDEVLWFKHDLTEAVAVKHVSADEFWAAGHIPGRPILPGVLQIEAAAQVASLIFYLRTKSDVFAGFTRIEDVSFRGQVLPGDSLVIACKEVKFNPKRFVTHFQGIVRGQIVSEGRITGMLLGNFDKMPRTSESPAGESGA